MPKGLLRKFCLAAAVSLAIPATASAQVQLVCQTPTFWCVILGPMLVNGVPCWCASIFGPIHGLTISPFPSVATPSPQDMPNQGTPNPPVIDLQEEGDECFDGLGNCQGAFRGYGRN